MADTFFADISSWQADLDDTYPFEIVSFREDYGGGYDSHLAANWPWARDTARIRVVIAYLIFKPGQAAADLARLKSFFGTRAPAKLAVEIDMESGAQFAGPGDHSTEADWLATQIADWLGTHKRVLAYANKYDYAGEWSGILPWLKRTTAAYGTQDPGTWGWQYYGGVAEWPSPAGYPRSCAPFGSAVDLNVIHRSIDQIVADLGLGEDLTMDAAVQAQFDEINTKLDALGKLVHRLMLGSDGHYHDVEAAVAHVTQGVPYESGKGHAYPALQPKPHPDPVPNT